MKEQSSLRPFPSGALRHWYEREKRDLPWRGSEDPYTIWVSEVILQQTRVDQGTPYFHRFMQTFPTVIDLANASEDAVLKVWEGLGYYSRARNMHAAAKQVLKEHEGSFPATYEGLRGLKGIGPYTAAAVGSIAFALPFACVDGNVIRVLTRFHGIADPVDSSSVIRLVNSLAEDALDEEHPAEHNQAMMELGATVCLPKSPDCSRCPLVDDCTAYRLGLVQEIPFKAKRTKVRTRYFHYLVLTEGDRTVLSRRAEGDIWQGLYEFPLIEADRELEADEALQRFDQESKGAIRDTFGPYRHLLSHQRIFARFIEVDVSSLKSNYGEFVSWAEVQDRALPRLLHRYLDEKMLAQSKNV